MIRLFSNENINNLFVIICINNDNTLKIKLISNNSHQVMFKYGKAKYVLSHPTKLKCQYKQCFL